MPKHPWTPNAMLSLFDTGNLSGFGSRLLVRQSYLGAKAGHPDQRFCRWKLLFYQQPCAKAREFCEAEFWDSTPEFYGGILSDFRIAGCLCSKSV